MYYYNFTHDLRASDLNKSLTSSANAVLTNIAKNNNINAVINYFCFTENSNCCKLAANGNTYKVLFNFIKKFQFPNINSNTLEKNKRYLNYGIKLAPCRVIIKTLYLMNLLTNNNQAYITIEEIKNFIFLDSAVAKNPNYDVLSIIKKIMDYRKNGNIPQTVEMNQTNIQWTTPKRDIEEIINVLLSSKYIIKQGNVKREDGEAKFFINNSVLTTQNKADIYDIINYNEFWEFDAKETNFEKIKKSYQQYMDIYDIEEDDDSEHYTENIIPDSVQRNRIFFGAPGTGKSYSLNEQKDELLSNSGEYERVTFHPDYSYAHFVGTYKPVPCIDNNNNDAITYEYVPGPFMRTLVKSFKNPLRPHLLIIEEINRANVSAVFGDVFQLLDRKNNVSEYPIRTSEDMRKYLAKELECSPEQCSEIKIPANMFIWATMNSADQGVFPMDTAFKRRWDFKYIGINDGEIGMKNKSVVLGKGEFERKVEWNELRKAINNELLKYRVNEDKLLGPYFISNSVLGDGNEIEPEAFIHVFKNKVLMYLFDDAARQKRSELFDCHEKNLYSAICNEFDEKGVFIFCNDISKKFTTKPVNDNSDATDEPTEEDSAASTEVESSDDAAETDDT